MTNQTLAKISKFFLYLIPFALLIVYEGSLFPFIVGKYTFFRTITEIALIFFVWAWAAGHFDKYIASIKKYLPKQHPREVQVSVSESGFAPLKNPLAVMLTVFVFIFFLSTFFGINPVASFWSNFERGEGSLQVLLLFVFFALLALLFRDDASWRRIFMVSIWVAILVSIYGALAAFHVDGFIGSNGVCDRFSGSLGNPAYVGTYMIFAMFYALYLFTSSDKSLKRKWWFLLLTVIFFVILLLSQTRGALLGLGIAALFGLIYLFIYLPRGLSRKIVLALIILGVILGPLAVIYRQDFSLVPFCPGGGSRILDVSFGGVTIQTRFILWEQSVKAFLERPILGWGPENFSTAFEKYFDTRHSAWFDRAHNIFFDYLVFSGALGLLSFIGIFVIFYLQFFKFNRLIKSSQQEKRFGKQEISPISNRITYEKALILALPIAYLVQGFVLFDVLPIYINIFIFLAFANYRFSKLAELNSHKA